MREITNGEFLGWKQDPITMQVFKKLQNHIQEIESFIGHGGTLDYSSGSKTAIATAHEIGKIRGIETIFELEIG